MIYRTLIFEYKFTGKQICLLLFDQNVIEYNSADYKNVSKGSVSAYDFIKAKIQSMDITPAQLALEPCSGSVVQTDVNTGEYLAVVTYPTFDNNKLANKIDWEYYQSLVNDFSSPMYSRATQSRTPTGSSIKPMIACIGYMNKVVTPTEKILDEVKFIKVDPSPSCWSTRGHGYQIMSDAIKNSCNYYFYEIGYRLGCKNSTNYSDQRGIDNLTAGAELFGFGGNSGIEIPESSPEIAKVDVIRASIGYGHKFTITQMAKYVTAIATKGTVYDMTIIYQITDKDDKIVYTSAPVIENKITGVSTTTWNQIFTGMNGCISGTRSIRNAFSALPKAACGKTGTAVISNYDAPSSLFICFYPMDKPETALACYINNGYSGANSGVLAGRIMSRYYNITSKDDTGSEIIVAPD